MPYAKLKVMGGRLAESLKNKIKLFLSSSMDTPISKVFYRIPTESGSTGVPPVLPYASIFSIVLFVVKEGAFLC